VCARARCMRCTHQHKQGDLTNNVLLDAKLLEEARETLLEDIILAEHAKETGQE
jgi:hypothetical protein